MKTSVSVRQANTREKARDRDILRGMSVKQEKEQQSEVDELMNEWVKIQTELQQLNASPSELVFDRQEFVRNTGAIINEVDIPVGIKQELMMAFQKFLPFGQDKTAKPDKKLVIEGDVIIEYVEHIVHDFDIPTNGIQDIIEGFRKLVKAKSGKAAAIASLAAKQESLQERIQAIVDDADIPDEQKEIYHQLRQVKTGTPLSNTVRVLLSRDGKKSSGEDFNPYGLTINQNGHVLVCDYGHGSVKTVTADTAQILTSVTVHGLPHNFKPTDTKMADNGDYYTADEGNKCIVVSDAKSEVKQIIAMGKLKEPTGVFVDKDRNVFIADYGADCVIKCNGDGDIISSRQLRKPRSLTMNSKYQLIVSCQGENCIYVLDSNLEILNQFGSDHLVNPWGVTVDNADNIYVADEWKIVKFDRQGEYQETVTVDVDPRYIAVFTDGRIVYSDDSDHTVKVIYK
ncbi:tripartite motif-containing protein 2-like [Ptychodera flava]|uniref:tripartite motif-containing protein 2-like n=1 Tax=Ptychodera flava TaxID=63121 RepID=UPI003969D984